ncbi:MAG TPA: glycerophosphodiester phosphodiesterase [Phototrophicaceae bacterium]|nr:glycerophosphodiester phosphodiesterase [Phototrophicaceae bacterium]
MPALLDQLRQGKTLIFGHRGASGNAPMNTLPAFELAAEHGADGIELDVWLSKDGEVVVIHDTAVDKTTNGTGHIQQMSLAELQELDAGSWFAESFQGTRIPTLDEVFETVGKRLFINVELKSITVKTDGLEKAVAEKIRQHNLADCVIISSFNPFALRRFRREMPEVPIGFLYAPDIPRYLQFILLGFPHEARHPSQDMVNAAYMAWARRRKYCVNVWTVNDPQRALELRDLGVNGIITDYPGKMREALRG